MRQKLHSLTVPIRYQPPPKATSLTDLPPELWIPICQTVIDLETRENNWAIGAISKPTPQPALSRVCRVLRDEVLRYFYSTQFKLTFWRNDSGYLDIEYAFADWLRAIGPRNRAWLRNVVVLAGEGEGEAEDVLQELRWYFGVGCWLGPPAVKEDMGDGWYAWGRKLGDGENGHLLRFRDEEVPEVDEANGGKGSSCELQRPG